jgi:iron complex outermembrane receptor protein
MYKNLITTAVTSAIFGSLLSLPSLALAQDSLQLEEVIVTARRRTESMQDVPIAVTVFTAADIQDAGIERPQDFIGLTPNVSIVDTANAGDTQVTIRGQYSTRDAESAFSYVVDGVLITNPNGFNGELFDVEQIEVLKGPQGALYGRNASSGAILVTTARPDNDFTGKIMAGVGDDSLVKGQGMVSGPLIKDKLYGRIAVSYRDTDGQFDNKFTGDDDTGNNLEEKNIRGRMIWEPSEQLTLDATASYRDVDAGAINFNAVFALPGAAEFLGVPELAEDVNDHNFLYVNNVKGENSQTTKFFSLKADYEMDFGTLTLIGAYDDMEEDLISDGTSGAFGVYAQGAPESQTLCTNDFNSLDYYGLEPGNSPLLQDPNYAIQDGNPPGTFIGPPAGLNSLLPPYGADSCDGYQYQERNQTSSSFEARLASNSEGRMRWMGGIYYAQIEREVIVAYGADLGLGFKKAPYVPPSGPNPTDQLFWDDFDTDVYSIFGQLEIDVFERGELALAARYDEEDRKVKNKVPNELSPQKYGNIPFLANAPINPAFDGSGTDTIPNRDETFDEFQPKVTYTQGLTDDLNVYASYGRGFRSGGFNSIGSEATVNGAFGTYPTAPQNQKDDYDKEVTDTFEVGMKSDWLNNRLRFNAAAFYTEIDDYQFFNFFAGPFGLLRVVNNVDEVEIYGAEFDFAWAVHDYVTLSGGYGMIDTEIKENNNRPYTEGNDLPYAPEGSGALSLDFKMPIFGELELLTRLDYEYVGETWFHTVQNDETQNFFTDLSGFYGVPGFGFGPSNYDTAKRDDYWKMNLRAGIAGENWSIMAWSQNVTDEEYLEEAIPAPEFGGSFIHNTAGRVSGVDFTYSF